MVSMISSIPYDCPLSILPAHYTPCHMQEECHKKEGILKYNIAWNFDAQKIAMLE